MRLICLKTCIGYTHLILKIKLSIFVVIVVVSSFSSDLYAAEVANLSSNLGVLSFVEKGGFMMYPILFCSIFVVGVGPRKSHIIYDARNIIDAGVS